MSVINLYLEICFSNKNTTYTKKICIKTYIEKVSPMYPIIANKRGCASMETVRYSRCPYETVPSTPDETISLALT